MKKTILLILICVSLLSSLVFSEDCNLIRTTGESQGGKVYFSPYSACEPKLTIEDYEVIKNLPPIDSVVGIVSCFPKLTTNFNSNAYTFYINPLDMKVTNTGIHDFAVFKGQNIIIANEVEGEYGESSEEETTWTDSPPIYFSGDQGIVCDATFTVKDNGIVVAEIPISEAQNFEYRANKPGIHYIETYVTINSCKANFDITAELCPTWNFIMERNEYCEPFKMDLGYFGEALAFKCWPRVTGGMYDSGYYFKFANNDQIVQMKLLISGNVTSELPSNLILNSESYIIEVKEPTPEFRIANINAIILPSGEKPPLHLINLWEKI